jgi:type VI secretion system protein ImpG
MPDDLLSFYERELSFLRQLGGEFAAKYPKVAGRLLLEADRSEDPHLERLIQAVAFLAARIQRKLDDDLPEVTDALLSVLYPHYLAPVPSMAIAQFVLDPQQGKLETGHRLAPGTMLYSQPVGGAPCRFRTCYPVTLWPIAVAGARVEPPGGPGPVPRGAAAVLRLELRCEAGAALTELQLDRLRLCLHGEPALVYPLYELLLNNVRQVQLRPLDEREAAGPVMLSPECLRSVGFEADEGMLPYTPRSFLGYRLLQEYFALPGKFLFVDLCELEGARQAGFRAGMEVQIFLDRAPRLEHAVTPETFRLGCTPIINLFEQVAEPIRVSHALTEYRVIPDVGRQGALEVYSVDRLTSMTGDGEVVEYQPFYSLRHAYDGERPQVFWYASRRPSERKGDAGTEVYLTLVDTTFRPAVPPAETLTIHTTCSNRDLPARLPFGGEQGDLLLEGAAPLSRIRCLGKPTEVMRPPLGRGLQWRLISHLSLNYLSICEGGREALQEILKLYDFSDSAALRQQIAGITEVRSRRIVGRPASVPWEGFCRGIEVSVDFDEEKYVGSGVFLFASVLERFLGLYSSLNSFVQMIATTRQREERLKRWPPRAGQQILL